MMYHFVVYGRHPIFQMHFTALEWCSTGLTTRIQPWPIQLNAFGLATFFSEPEQKTKTKNDQNKDVQ